MEKKAIRVAYGEAIVKLAEKNDKVVVLDADLAAVDPKADHVIHPVSWLK